jgi:HAD superfamily hydrolase (TIGR01549 family)
MTPMLPLPRAILLDLDDTLLANDMDSFAPAYFQSLARYMALEVDGDLLLTSLLRATHAMETSGGGGATNEETCAGILYPGLGRERDELEPIFNRFYIEEFPKLERLTKQRPVARQLVQFAFEAGLQVVIATHPLFPRRAIEERLRWAGVPVSDFDYALVTSYEEMTCGKATPAYYAEIARRLGRQPSECLMVGDDWERDVVGGISAGLRVFWIADAGADPPQPPRTENRASTGELVGWGTLEDLYRALAAR